MERHQALISYLLVFILLAIILKLLGLDLANSQILSYALIFYGISSVYTAFGQDQKLYLFTGGAIFLSGVFLFIINTFEFISVSKAIPPAILFIGGICFLLLFYDDSTSFFSAIIGILLILLSFITTIRYGNFNITSFVIAIWDIIKVYWIVVIVAILILFFLKKDDGKDSQK